MTNNTANDNDNIEPQGKLLLQTVGYCKPPKHSQFKKGQSGNPHGRPKKPKTVLAVAHAIFEKKKVAVVINGKSTKVSFIEAILMKLMVKALQGNQPAMNKALDLYSAIGWPDNDNEIIATGSSFELTDEDVAAIEKSNLLKVFEK